MKARLLRLLYPRVIDGLPLLGTPADVALRYTDEEGHFDVDRLVAHYTSMSGTTGFVTGLPGFLLLPIVLPADLIGNAAIQLHMTAAIAIAAGFDPRNELVREQCFRCLLSRLGDAGHNEEDQELARRGGVKVGERVVRFAAARALKSMATRAGRRIGLGRRLPLLGGFLSASTDATLTRHVGECARTQFFPADR